VQGVTFKNQSRRITIITASTNPLNSNDYEESAVEYHLVELLHQCNGPDDS
jgi:hypothetical protein